MPSQKLIVLGLFEGDSFPTPKTHNEQVYVKARLDDVWLETEAVKADSNPDLNTELVWDMTKTQLKALRTKKAPIKLEVWQADEKLGYLVLDLRNALPVRDDQQPNINKMKLLGSKHKPIPSLQVSLAMEDVPGDDDEESSVTESLSVSAKGSVVTTRHREVSSALIPVLDEEKGYFRIGPETKNQQKFSFGVCIVFARHLNLLLPSDLAVNPDDQYYFQYDLLGSDISTEPFKGLAEPDFKAEKATALIKSTATSMEQFFRERGSLSVKVVRDSCILGEAHLNLSDVMPVRAETILSSPVSYEGRIPVVSAHNFRIAKDDNGDFPQIGIEVLFRKEDATITPDASKDITGMDIETTQDNLDLTEGQLSYSEVQQSSISSSDNTKQRENDEVVIDITNSPAKHPDQQSVHPSPAGGSPPVRLPGGSHPAHLSGGSPPIRLPVSPREKHTRNVSVELFPEDRQTDDTIYLSPPKQPRLTPQPDESTHHPLAKTRSETVPVVKPQVYAPDVSSESGADSTTRFSQVKPKQKKAEPFSTYKWTVDLKTIVMSRSFSDLTLTYKYKPFSRNSISTSPGFAVVQGKPTVIPRGFCEFNFSVPESKLKATLAKHFLEINVEEDEVVTAGLASINQTAVFSVDIGRNGRVYDGVVDIVHMGSVVGKLQYQLAMDTPDLHPLGEERRDEREKEVEKMEVSQGVGSVVDPELRARMTAEAAKELELWKLEQMKEFNELKKKYHENLVKERQQHLTTLGEEWKEREMAREIELEQKKQVIEALEKELQQALENIELEKVELRKQKADLEEEKKNLKDEKGQALEKMKAKLRSAEGEIGKQAVELEIHAKKTCHLEEEVARLEKEQLASRGKEVETLGQLTKLRAEKTTWQASLEQSEKAKEFYKKSWHAVKTELEELRTEKEKMQSDKIERLESELNEMRKKAASDNLLQSELSHLRRQHAASRLEASQHSSETRDGVAVRSSETRDSVAVRCETRDSVFEDNYAHEIIPAKQRSIDTEMSGFDVERPTSDSHREITNAKVGHVGGSAAGESLRLKERGTSVSEDIIKLKQRNRDDIARLRKTMSVNSVGSDNRKKITKQLSVGGTEGKKPDFLEDEINLMRPVSRNENIVMRPVSRNENIGLTRVRSGSSMDDKAMSVLENNTDTEMTTSSPQTVRKSKPCWGGGVAMPVLTPKTQLQKLIDEKNMLLRTGVYSEDDHLVSRLTKEIIKIQQS